MTDRSSFDAFEQRLAGELAKYVALATDPKPAADIADAAMQPRGIVTRARSASARRRFLTLGIAAALLVPAVYLGAGSIRPAPDNPKIVQVSPSVSRSQSPPPVPSAAQEAVSIFVRRIDDVVPGLSVFAVGPDGAETLIRHIPDSVVPAPGRLSEGGTVSEAGWLALGTENLGQSWPLVLIDLRDEQAPAWVITDASTGGIGPRWGPTGLIAADAGGVGGRILIGDPATRSTTIISMHAGLIGGGPSIVWAGDGTGIVGSTGTDAVQVVPIDGGQPRPGVGDVYDPRGVYGPGLAHMSICLADVQCATGSDGHIERVDLDGSAQTIWRQSGADRALSAGFGSKANEYWLAIDHANGRQLVLHHLQPGHDDAVATVNREATWQYIGEPTEAPDGSVAVAWIDLGAKPAAVVVPLHGGPQTFHTGQFAGFVARSALAAVLSDRAPAPGTTVPPVGQAYRLPSVDELIAAELALNPGEHVLGTASREAVEGDTVIRTFEVHTIMPGGQVHLDCIGPASVTLTTGAGSTTSSCLSAGGYIMDTGSNTPITVRARGDTSWRVVVYAP